MTNWKWRIYLFVLAADNTAANRQSFASIFVSNGSGETAENEAKLFNSVVKLSATGQLPAQAFGINVAAKTAMRDGFKALLDSLTNARYVVVANSDLSNYRDGEFVMTNCNNLPIDPAGKIITWQQALNFLNREFGLQIIPE